MLDLHKIWSPKLRFDNSADFYFIEATSGNQKSGRGTGHVKIIMKGQPQHNSLTELYEDYLYTGNENAIVMDNHMVVKLECKFNLKWYPFDSQICPITLSKDSSKDNEKYIFKWLHLPKIIQGDLLQYEVFPSLQYKNNATNNSIEVAIRLRRKLASHIFDTYLPTVCLIIIAGWTLFIDHSHFEATIMVALTTMLVIYTLHQSIYETLPSTAYLKMVDIWLFGGLIVPFVIIGILIFLDYLVMKETSQVMDLKNIEKNKWNSEFFIKSMQIMLPLTAGILMGSYWIIGLMHYFA